MSVNRVIILGRLGQEPELKHTKGGQAVCHLRIATSERWNDKSSGQPQEKTEWHNVECWGKTGELANKFLSKGSSAYVEGKLETRSWEDKDGKKRYTTSIKASNIQFLNNNKDKNEALKDAHDKNDAKEYEVASDSNFASDDIPF